MYDRGNSVMDAPVFRRPRIKYVLSGPTNRTVMIGSWII
jgi:hypothetical protein